MFNQLKGQQAQVVDSAVTEEPNPRGDPVVDAVLKSGVVLPPYPPILQELDQLMAEEDFELARLVEVVARDPSLTAALLRVANSPVFGLRQSVFTLLQAVTVLGLARVRAVLRSVVLRDVLRDYGDPALIHALWLRFGAIADLAASLASRSTLLKPQADLAYTIGMFHGTGTFLIVKRFPLETCGLARAGAGFEALLAWLDAELGTHHAAIGALIARNWRLPPEVAEAIAHQHHCPAESSVSNPARGLTCLLRLAIALHDGGEKSDAWPTLWDTAHDLVGLDESSLADAIKAIGGAVQSAPS